MVDNGNTLVLTKLESAEISFCLFIAGITTKRTAQNIAIVNDPPTNKIGDKYLFSFSISSCEFSRIRLPFTIEILEVFFVLEIVKITYQ